MKKIFAILLALALLAALPFATFAASESTTEEINAEATEMNLILEGVVAEVVEGGFILQDKTNGEMMINTSEATVWDGLLAEAELEAGQYVFVDFNGIMTRSLPPQAHADRVSLYVLSGMVTEKLEDGSILVTDDVNGEVIVHLGEGMSHVNVGSPITVYHNGVMAMSLPAQITASHIRLHLVSGEVAEVTEEGFLMTAEDGQTFMVNVSEETLYTVEYQPVTIPAFPSEEDGKDSKAVGETEAEEETPETIEPAVGDKVTVYYNGAATRSIPAQIFALEVVTLR